MTITTHDEARLLATIQQRCTALRQQLCDDLHAMVVAGALNEEWKAVADQQRETIARLEQEKANLSAHLETVATERDELRSRVMELEKKLKAAVPAEVRDALEAILDAGEFVWSEADDAMVYSVYLAGPSFDEFQALLNHTPVSSQENPGA